MSIYSELILDHYQTPHNYGSVSGANAKVAVANPLCGDKIEMSAKLKDGRVVEIKFEGVGCAISKAATSMLTDYVKGKSKDQLQKLDKDFIIKMLGIELGVNRIKCALLPLEALKKLLVS